MEDYCGSEFWNLSLTWYTDYPDLSPCFQSTVLVWVPCLFLLLGSVFEIYSATRSQAKDIPWTYLNIAKIGITSLLALLQLLEFGFYICHDLYREDEIVYPVYEFTPGIKFLTFLLVIFLDIFNKKNGVRSSGPIFIFWLLFCICDIPSFRSSVTNPELHPKFQHAFLDVLEIISFPLLVAQVLLNCWADAAPEYHKTPLTQERPCPEKASSFLNRLIFFWFEPLARKGYQKTLTFSDLWNLNVEDSTKVLNPEFSRYWNKSVEKIKRDEEQATGVSSSYGKSQASIDFKHLPRKRTSDKKASVLPVLFKVFGGTFFLGASLKFCQDLLMFTTPQLLNLLIGFVEGEEESWKGYLYAVLLFTFSCLATFFGNQYFYKMFMLGVRMRTVVVSAIYAKSLRISNNGREESTTGEIVNLMSVDAQRLVDLCSYLNTIWSAPFQIFLALYFLWGILGPSVLSGLGVMVLLIPLNGVVGAKTKALQMKQMKYKDRRIKLMNEILSGIKVLKLYGWEKSFQEQIMKIRKQEMKVLRQSAFLNATFVLLWTVAPFLVSVVTFATYVLVDPNNILDAKKAFVSLTLFNIMRFPLNILPMMIVYLIQASVSVKRINKFLNSEEVDESAIGHDTKEEDAIVIQNGSFAWKHDLITLRNINLRVKEGSLVAIVGTVGSGKSSLLSAILGDIDKVSGRVNTKGSCAYVSQQPFIQNTTLRNNVLFGMPFDGTKYDKIIEACALKPDLKMLPGGDLTEIGERGINLSGGQKQRVSLARATYNYADLYLFDDPLSAVDSHVGKHLFEKVIGPKGYLRRKTRVLVTHSITYLPEVDKIFVLKNGEISEAGTYRELLDRKGDFAEFLLQHLSSEEASELESTIITDLEKTLGAETIRRRKSLKSESSDGGDQKHRFSRQFSTLSRDSKEFEQSMNGSIKSLNEGKKEMQGNVENKLIEAEGMEVGSVKMSVFLFYMKSVGWKFAIITAFGQFAFQAFSVGSNAWLTVWSNDKTNDTGTRDLYLGVYGGLGVGQGISILLSSIILAIGTLKASALLHFTMLDRIIRAPMWFFDTTPLGRIVNRFSKDVDTADNGLSMTISFWMNCLFSVVATLGVISYSTPIFIAVIVPIGILYFLAQRFYVATLRQLRRLESVTRSPIYSHFAESLAGTSTIRAFRMQDRFINDSEAKIDQNQECYFPSSVASRFLAVCLELIGNVIIFFAALFAVIAGKTIDPGLVGLSVSYALQITMSLNWLVKMTSDVETNLVSVERLKEYGEVPQEADWEVPEKKPGKNWPENGEVVFQDYKVRYREGLDLVLHGVSFKINGGEKVGIVGRTGAGKSSLTIGLFRIVEASSGSILIDGYNISSLGLHDVRKRLTVIPQDPVIFSGTLRLNLDPFDDYKDEAIWRALELAHLKAFVKGLSNGLEYELTEGGDNLSVGQRQLVCLTRALLRKTKILVLDEATAAVDLETDDLIQETIRTEFKDCTIVTIAHRLNTVLDYDRIMVLDKGKITEFDNPDKLLQNKDSMFYAMAKDAGIVP